MRLYCIQIQVLRDKNHCLPVHLSLLLFSFDSLSSSQDKFFAQREMQPGHQILLTLAINNKKKRNKSYEMKCSFPAEELPSQ